MDSNNQIKPDEIEILIVEDSPTQAERLRRLIQSLHYNARVAANGQLALAAIRERKPHLVLSDIVMPEMNGYDLCRAIKSDPTLRDIPVILVTSLNDPKDIIRGIECGADNFIRKPYAEDYLLNRISHMLMNQKLRKNQNVEIGIALYLGDQKHFINAERQQILDLLISTYEQAVQVNGELQARERQVIELNMRLAHHAAELETINREIALKNLELAEASRMKSAFIANMSHELRTPLNAIIGFTGALLMKLPGPLTSDQDKQLNTIRASARHLLSLINDILDVAKIEAGKLTLSIEPVHCQDLMAEVADTLRPLAQQKGLALEMALGEAGRSPAIIETDRRALTQILINLLNNAIKFTEQGTVRISLAQREEDGMLVTEMSIADSGAGIKEEDQAKLFQAFSQLDSTSTRHVEGAGLGLYLCQNLANAIGGALFFNSDYGSGSTFTLALRSKA
ncbi:signal transduction histidine-protein kinase BarA [Janthinobacterium sp. HH103]|uniref:hybrid sensor histidine kinase/response regulator n=1 Tax=unclassified Janthinobacterium TaxID=2610881 RepID=UPI00087440B3|nr:MULTISPECIES: response regulator [unclassified Janthinobacterium]OEZ59982.1 signal transduction histidine-protein kinase BarA [Janthinobacterium sp. HH100]OEZ70114.1 signal transduction histidine-protein kinase BarA [Janthinobacterium sp. HH103]OEZ87903.1 signal transduction histidine-protein kinase BarA [Janthinobacterium sp. HH106]QOU75388.1 Sensor histidine kinase RcsC [Janthinobacterium sp. HH102]